MWYIGSRRQVLNDQIKHKKKKFHIIFFFLGCYGVHDSGSVSSSVSSCSMEPWFCEACKAGIENPTCELCPNFGTYTILNTAI